MIKFLKLICLFLFFLIFFYIFNYYLSNINVNNINNNRLNIEDIIKEKAINLKILKNDTKNVIEFNSGFSEEINKSEPRKFWNLIKLK